ncbi:hypothetical protein FB645_000840 [Coemansia sp. IMI 203386]|nr:hypothetical protein FB645_000840 [Coemansia sp. IMI 203386]
MPKTCYYELLGVARNATDSDLKKAYRKQALIWHPDKNHGNTEETTRVFAEIKEAYETLSDAQERAWYDNHREQILRGDDFLAAAAAAASGGGSNQSQSANVNYASTDFLMRFFSVSSFRGYDDTPTGFYTVYRELFARLRDEELDVYDPETDHQIDYLQNLDFGDSFTVFDEDASYANNTQRSKKSNGTGTTLRDFYNYWTTFSSRKSFGWFDRFRLSDAENRQIRRLMEKENKVLREKAKREFTEAVQNLAAWLKKRDPRYKRYVEMQQKLKNEREELRKRRLAEQRVSAMEDASAYVRQAWEEVDYTTFLDEHFEHSEDDDSDDDRSGSGSADQLSVNDFDDDDDNGSAHSSRDVGAGSADDLDPENQLACIVCDKTFKTMAQKDNHDQSKKHQKAVRELRREMVREERRMAKIAKAAAKAQGIPVNKPANPVPKTSTDADADAHAAKEQQQAERDLVAQMDLELNIAQPSKSKKSKKKRRQQAKVMAADDAEPADSGDRLSEMPDILGHADTNSDDDNVRQNTGREEPYLSRTSKKELRRERQKKKSQAARGMQCNVCSETFDTRNQLFKHINETGHALASTASFR